MNLLHRGATKLRVRGGWQEPSLIQRPMEQSDAENVVVHIWRPDWDGRRSAWAQYHNFPTVDSPRNQTGSMAPHEMTVNTQALPVQQYDAI